MLCLTQARIQRSLKNLFRLDVGAVACEGVRQGQVPIRRLIGKGGFSKNNGEIGAPIIFALRNRLACPTLDIEDVKGCRTPEPLHLFYSPLWASDIPFKGGGRGKETRNIAHKLTHKKRSAVEQCLIRVRPTVDAAGFKSRW